VIVVDASVVVDWVQPGSQPDSPARRALARWAAAGEALAAPRLMREEVTNALLTGVRRRRWTGSEADAAFVLLRDLPVPSLDTAADLERAFDLSRRHDEHPVYDMLYVALAERLGATLVTADEQLARRLATVPHIQALTDAVPDATAVRDS
jgi:predicted nucleic acid-binding protein